MLRPARKLLLVILIPVLFTSCFSQGEPGQLSVYGPYVGREADIFSEALDAFEAKTGITTNYVGSSSFQSDFEERVNSGQLPDVIVLPTLALLGILVENDQVTALDAETTVRMTETVGEFWSGVLAANGRAIAVPYRFVVKSIVWYRADVFEKERYEIPPTLADLMTLARQMVRDGYTPWCAGMDSQLATGWWATDWVEDLVVREADIDTYWSWAQLDTPFTDPAIVSAMSELQDFFGSDDLLNGGRRALLNTRVEDAITPMFDEQPGCLMHKQASFQPVWLPDGVEFGDGRLNIFPLPGVKHGNPPMMISGEVIAVTSASPQASAFMKFLLTDEALQPWLERGGSLVAREGQGSIPGGRPLDRRLAQWVEDAPTVVLDASDLMPPAIGSDAFFSGMIDLVAGRSPEDVAARIQDAIDGLPSD